MNRFKKFSDIKDVKVIYYSGTGGTRRVAECIENRLKDLGKTINIHRLESGSQDCGENYDLLFVLYAVHACNAPAPVYKWIDSMNPSEGKPAVVISVSGGGEVSPNTACRLHCIKKLKKKGFDVIYEDMIVMPSNWITATKEPLALLMLQWLPKKVDKIICNVLAGAKRRTTPKVIDRLFSFIGEAEKFGANRIGRKMKVSDTCTGCGWCRDNCPSGNIRIENHRPKFDGNCHLCLSCIYGCPKKALRLGNFKFIAVKEGYDLGKLESMLPIKNEVDIESLATGYLWSGVKKYLMELNDE